MVRISDKIAGVKKKKQVDADTDKKIGNFSFFLRQCLSPLVLIVNSCICVCNCACNASVKWALLINVFKVVHANVNQNQSSISWSGYFISDNPTFTCTESSTILE